MLVTRFTIPVFLPLMSNDYRHSKFVLWSPSGWRQTVQLGNNLGWRLEAEGRLTGEKAYSRAPLLLLLLVLQSYNLGSRDCL